MATNIDKKNLNVPNMRFKEFEGEWKEVRLKDIVTKSAEKNRNNKIETVFSNSAIHGIVLQEEYFDRNIVNKDNLVNYYIVRPDDFVYNPRLSNNAEVGAMSVNHIGITGVVSPLYTIFRINSGSIFPTFLEFIFQSKVWHSHMRDVANFGARDDRMNIKSKDFYSLPMQVPSLEEQEKIAHFLSLIDKRISTQSQIIEQLESLIKGLNDKLLNCRNGNIPNLRFREFHNSWEHIRLKEIAIKVNKKNVSNEISIVFSNSAIQGIIQQSDYFNKDIANKDNLSGYYIVEPNDFVYNPRLSSNAEVGAMNVNHTDCIGLVSPLYTVFRVSDNAVTVGFLECIFKSKVWHNYMRNVANYGARDDRMNIKDGDLFNLNLCIPETIEQLKLVNLTTILSNYLQVNKDTFSAYMQQKAYLLRNLFI